ncbi:MAG: GAF domain-containing protein [Leptospiraceae bacterium]|nr:GAF domain-containing protein [Leptospiraceae bacterium]
MQDNNDLNLHGCDKEPIHIPSAIQSHGFLLEISEKQEVYRCSNNISDFLGYESEEIFLLGVQALAPDLLPKINSFPALLYEPSGIFKSSPIQFHHKNGVKLTFDAIISKSRNGYLVECERSDVADDIEDISSNLLSSIMNARGEGELGDFLTKISDQIRATTGYERVMIYRFDDKWNGEVVAESKKEDLHPFLGQNFPSSDIPAQARQLYLSNLIRLIPDISYKPASLIQNALLKDNSILDQSYSVLRSVSPIHIEYLQNMGVKGTLTVSILIQGKLWGLLACHQYSSAKYLSFGVRNSILLLTQFTSLKIESFLSQKRDEAALKYASIQNILLEQMASASNFLEGLIKGKVTLLDFIESTGAAVLLGNDILTLGETPDLETIQALARTFEKKLDSNRIFTSNCLSQIDSAWERWKDTASGLLMVQIKSTSNLSILWFRKERPYSKVWGGDPNKAVGLDGNNPERLHPRKSFESWYEEVKLTSLPWIDVEKQAALTLKLAIKGTILKKYNEISSLFSEMDLIRFREEKATTSLREKEILLKEIHHRVKNNMQIIVALLYMQSDMNPHPDVRQALIESQNRIKTMAIIHEILYANDSFAHIDMNEYFSDLVEHLASSQSLQQMPEILIDVQEILFSLDTAIPCGLILNEAITNCFKYAFPLTSKNLYPKIYIHLAHIEDRVELSIADNGVGFPSPSSESTKKSLGHTLIEALSKQLGAKLSFGTFESRGAKIKIEFSADRIYKGNN